MVNPIFLGEQTENEAKIPGYKAQPRFLALFTLTTTTHFPTMRIMAIHLWEWKCKRLHISIKRE